MATRKTSVMGSGLRTFAGLTLLTAGFLGTLATILGFFGSTSWFFDVLANFRFQLAVGLIVLGVLYLVGFGRAVAFIFVVMGLVNAFLVAPLYLEDPAPAADDNSIRIVSFNVGAGRADTEELASWVDESDADLVFLLESTEEWVGAVPTGDIGYSISNEIPSDRQYGISVLGRDSAAVEQLRLGTARDPVVRVQTTIAEQPVAVYAIHPRPPNSSARSEARDALFDELAALVEAETIPVIVIGDFNASPWSYAFRELVAETELVNSQLGYGLAATWPTGFPGKLVAIDHMLHSEELTTVERVVGPDLGSDHLPLTVQVAVAAG